MVALLSLLTTRQSQVLCSCGGALAHCDVTIAVRKVYFALECGVVGECSLGGSREAVEQVTGCGSNAAADSAASAVCKCASLQGMHGHVSQVSG